MLGRDAGCAVQAARAGRRAIACTWLPTTAPIGRRRSPSPQAWTCWITTSSLAARVRRWHGRSSTCSAAPTHLTPSWWSTPTPSSTRRCSWSWSASSPPVHWSSRASTGCATPERRPAAGLRAIALALRHHLRPLGRTALGRQQRAVRQRHGVSLERPTRAVVEQPPDRGPRAADGAAARGDSVAYAPDAVVEAAMPSTLEAKRDAERPLGARPSRARAALRPPIASARRRAVGSGPRRGGR